MGLMMKLAKEMTKESKGKPHDSGHWNLEGILKNDKRSKVKFKEHKPKGKALALSKKLLGKK